MTFFDWYQFFIDGKVDFCLSFILCNYSKLDILVLKFRIVNLENKVPLVINGSDTKIETDKIVLMIWDKLFVLFLTGNFNFRIASFDSDFSLITQLLYTFTETGNHFQIKILNSLIRNYLLPFINRETDIIRHTTCLWDNLINHIITNGTIFKTYNINNAWWGNCIFYS